jgi:large subunit ribosomal protein L20
MNKEKIFKFAKGFRGRNKNCIRLARNRVEKALQHAYVSRKLKKREARSEWIVKTGAAAREHGVCPNHFFSMPYSHLFFVADKVLESHEWLE